MKFKSRKFEINQAISHDSLQYRGNEGNNWWSLKIESFIFSLIIEYLYWNLKHLYAFVLHNIYIRNFSVFLLVPFQQLFETDLYRKKNHKL